MFPIQSNDLVQGNRPLVENQHQAKSIGKIWITGQVLPRQGGRCPSNPFYKAYFGECLREQQVLYERMACFVDIRINFMGNRRPGFGGEAHTNVAADLTDKNRLAFKPHRCKPQAQVVSFVDTAAWFLARQILMATESIQ